jgi:hypothetical protein
MAYTSSSAQDRLDAVRESIAACLVSQEYTQRGRKQRMAELKQLRDLEKDLMQEVNASSDAGCMASLAVATRPT